MSVYVAQRLMARCLRQSVSTCMGTGRILIYACEQNNISTPTQNFYFDFHAYAFTQVIFGKPILVLLPIACAEWVLPTWHEVTFCDPAKITSEVCTFGSLCTYASGN